MLYSPETGIELEETIMNDGLIEEEMNEEDLEDEEDIEEENGENEFDSYDDVDEEEELIELLIDEIYTNLIQ